jgi:tyrosine-protein kinase Etk/Wzc
MNETQAIATNNNRQGVENEANVVELAIMLAKHKKLVIGLPVIAALVAAAVSFALPNVYMASTKLLPPQQPQSGAAALLSQLGGVASVVGGGSGIKNPNEVFIAMLKSRTVADRLVKKYDLMRVYGSTSPEKTRQALASDTTVAAGKDGLITIDVEGLDPAMVAKLANSYVDELLNLTGELAVTEAAQRRKFFERQLDISKDKLAAAEMTLKRALDTRGVISVDSESRAILETVGRLRAQLAAKEIQLSSMQAFVTTNNPEYRRAQEELNSLRSELSKLENGRPAIAGTGEQQSGQKPVGLENIKILREVKYHQMLYELLAKQYEAARLDEAKDAAVIQVLDSAIKPERKYKPKRSILVLGAALGGLFVAALWAFMSELRQAALRVPEHAAQMARLKSYLLGR